jgi:hypothetical protein
LHELIMAGELTYKPSSGQLVYAPSTGQLALNCAPPCDTCPVCTGATPCKLRITLSGVTFCLNQCFTGTYSCSYATYAYGIKLQTASLDGVYDLPGPSVTSGLCCWNPTVTVGNVKYDVWGDYCDYYGQSFNCSSPWHVVREHGWSLQVCTSGIFVRISPAYGCPDAYAFLVPWSPAHTDCMNWGTYANQTTRSRDDYWCHGSETIGGRIDVAHGGTATIEVIG